MSLHTTPTVPQPGTPQPLQPNTITQQNQETPGATAPAMVQTSAPPNPTHPLAFGQEREDDSSDDDSVDLPHSPPDVAIRSGNSSSANAHSVPPDVITMIARDGDLQRLHDALLYADTPFSNLQQPLIYWVVKQMVESKDNEATNTLGIDIIKRLVALGASVTLSEENYIDALDIALEHNNEALFSVLLEASVNQGSIIDLDKSRLLKKACNNNSAAMAQLLLIHGADASSADLFGKTPLHIACEKGDVNLVSMLTAAGAQLNAIDRITGNTPLLVACIKGNNPVVQLLAGHCPIGVIQHTNLAGKPALYFAAVHCNLDSFQSLLDAQIGAHQFELDKIVLKGFTTNKQKIPEWEQRLTLFLSRLPDIDSVDADGRTLLFYAASSGDMELVEALIDLGANPLHVDNSGRTASDYGVMFSETNDVFFYLEEVKATRRANIPRDSNSSAD